MTVEAIGYLIICVMFGVAAIGYSVYQRSKLEACASWPQTMGKITKADVVRETANDSIEYRVHLLYDYEVNGSRYTGKRIALNTRSFIRKKSAQAQLDRFPVNSTVAVYFNPEKPDEAVLMREAPYNTTYLVMGILALVFSAAIVFFSVRLHH